MEIYTLNRRVADLIATN